MNSRLRLLSIIALFLLAASNSAVRAGDLPLQSPEKGSIGVFSSTFDPFTLTHLELAVKAAQQFGLEKVMIIPLLNGASTDFETRWALLQKSIEGQPELELPPKELVLAALKSPAPQAELLKRIAKIPGVQKTYGLVTRDQITPLPKTDFIVYDSTNSVEPAEYRKKKSIHWWTPKIKTQVTEADYRKNALLGEAFLPEAEAHEIKRLGLYGRGIERGYYDLPPTLVHQLDYEQLMNDRIEDDVNFKSIVEDNEVPQKFLPENRPVFYLYTVTLPEKDLLAFGDPGLIPTQLVVDKKGKRFIKFLVHPLSEKLYKKRFADYPWTQEMLATSTSSYRSLVAWDPKTEDVPIGAKTSLNLKVGGFRRNLSPDQIKRAGAVSQLLHTVSSRELAKHGILFMDEPVGFLPQGEEFKGGLAFRTLPQKLPKNVELIPMFSLYSKPLRGDPPLVAMIKKSGMSAKDFITKYVIQPTVDQQIYLSIEHGIIGEPHEQNVLMEVKKGTPTGRFWYRDLYGYAISNELRAAKGKDLSFLNGTLKDWSEDSEKQVVERTRLYLRGSNFFALQTSVGSEFPEITPGWVDKTFRHEMRKSITSYTGQPIADDSLASATKAVNRHIAENVPCKALTEAVHALGQ